MKSLVDKLNRNTLVKYFTEVALTQMFVFFVLLAIRGIEFFLIDRSIMASVSTKEFFEFMLYFELLNALNYSFLFHFIGLPVYLLSKKRFLIFRTFLLYILFLAVLFLTGYYLQTGQLLGAEMSNYSTEELIKIIKTSLNIGSVVSLMLSILLLVFLIKGFNKLSLSNGLKKIRFVSLLIVIPTFFIVLKNYNAVFKIKSQKYFDSSSAFMYCNSKVSYFIHSNKLQLEAEAKHKIFLEKLAKYQLKNYQPGNSQTPQLLYRTQDPRLPCSISSYFKIDSTLKPNVVFILVESLSSSFSGEDNYLGSLTPFLDSLSKHSLVWSNALSNATKTYGVLPNVLSSTPYGGFRGGVIKCERNTENKYPAHKSLISFFNSNGYQTKMFYTDDSSFDEMGAYTSFLELGEFVEKEDFIARKGNLKEYVWGLGDDVLFQELHKNLLNTDVPQFNIALTLGIHHPYDQNKVEIEEAIKKGAVKISESMPQDIAASVLTCDYHLKTLFDSLKLTKRYKESIFVIVGDHNIGPLKLKNPLEIYHVPLIIYSPLLVETGKFKSIVTQRDIYPTLVSLLSQNYNLKSEEFKAMGKQLSTDKQFSSNQETSLSLYKETGAPRLLLGRYYLSGENVYEIEGENLDSRIIEDQLLKDSIFRFRDRLIREDLIFLEGSNNY